eukprot:COSAG02_NODE_1413_length_12752_cov_4.305777_4_plen_322_part_00
MRGEELLGTPLPPGTLLRRELVGTGAARSSLSFLWFPVPLVVEPFDTARCLSPARHPNGRLSRCFLGAGAAAGGRRLSLLQFNVLADGLSGNCEGKGGFTLIPSAWLDWEQRWPLLLKVIQQTDADIVALQEVDHVDQWVKAMDGLGYEGQVRIDERSPCLKASLGDPATGEKFPDAVALFWRRERLSVDECQHGVDGEYKSKVLTARLRCLESGSYFVAVNMHLDSKKSEKGVRIRAEQSRNLLSEVSAFAQHEAKPAAAVLIAGDLNATRAEECHSSILQADFGDRLGAIRDAYADAGFSEDFTSLKIRTGSYKAGKAK